MMVFGGEGSYGAGSEKVGESLWSPPDSSSNVFSSTTWGVPVGYFPASFSDFLGVPTSHLETDLECNVALHENLKKLKRV